MIRIQLVCDACGQQSDHHTSLGLNLRDDTEAAGWVWVITDGRMEHVCPEVWGMTRNERAFVIILAILGAAVMVALGPLTGDMIP